jgi:hypothetical protein
MGRKPKQLHPEDIIHAAIVQHLELRGQPGLVYWHTPNGSKLGGARTNSGVPLAAIRLKKMGLRPGVSDLVFLYRGKFFALELKSPGQRPTETQDAFMDAVNNADGYATWSDDLDRALRILEAWGLLRNLTDRSKLLPSRDSGSLPLPPIQGLPAS